MARLAQAATATQQATAARMQVIYVLGGHETDAGRLFGGLLAEQAQLASRGVVLVRPRRLRQALEPVAARLRDGAAPGSEDVRLAEQLAGPDGAGRLVLSGEPLLGPASQAVREGLLYPFVAGRARTLRDAVHGHDTVFVIALRNPAALLPAIGRKTAPDAVAEILADAKPHALRWVHTLRRLREAVPDAPVIAWCHEDTPLLWDEIAEVVTGLPADAAENGDGASRMAYLRTLLTEEGARIVADALDGPPSAGRAEARRAIAAGLAAHARPGVLEMDLSDTGWTQDEIDRLTAGYHADLDIIARMDGVTLLSPWATDG